MSIIFIYLVVGSCPEKMSSFQQLLTRINFEQDLKFKNVKVLKEKLRWKNVFKLKLKYVCVGLT